jgi:hypothetical protein
MTTALYRPSPLPAALPSAALPLAPAPLAPVPRPRSAPPHDPAPHDPAPPSRRPGGVRVMPQLEPARLAGLAEPVSWPRGAELRPDDGEPDPGERALRYSVERTLRLALEVVSGHRPPGQLTGLVSESVLRYVMLAAGQADLRQRWSPPVPARHRAAPPTTAGISPGAGLRALRTCIPTDGVAEVSAVWRRRGRYRALAARFDTVEADPERSQLWRCTALRLG